MFARALSACLLTLAAGLSMPVHTASAETKTAIFAGGCFWCVESDFDAVPGVISTTSGYIGGTSQNPTYYDHTAAGHREAVRIEYDDATVDYAKLLDVFWHSVDPTDDGGQFCDRGHSYTTAIYAVDKDDLATAEKSKAEIAGALGQKIVTEIAAAPAFWPAEDYHQGYYKKNPVRYKYYRGGCGRDARLEDVWGEAALRGIEAH